MKLTRLVEMIRKLKDQRRSTRSENTMLDDITTVLAQEERSLATTYIHLGIDFGTCFTKVCFRQLESEVSGIIEVDPANEYGFVEASLRLSGDRIIHPLDADWGSRKKNALLIPYIKMAMLDKTFNQEGLPMQDIETLLIYYLARVIQASRERFIDAQPNRVYKRIIQWSGSIGLPVKYYDSKELGLYQSLIDIAWVLSERIAIPSDLGPLKEEIVALKGTISDDRIPFTAIPEIAAGIFPFVKSQASKDSMYIYYDIGGGTSDGVAFNVKNWSGQKSVNFYSTSIEPIGIIGLIKAYASSQDARDHQQVKMDLFTQESVIRNFNMREAEQAVKSFVAGVIMHAKERDDTAWFSQVNDQLTIFIGGGGLASKWYIRSIKRTHSQVKRAGIPQFNLRKIRIPEDLEFSDLDEKDFHRYAIAYGLSHPFYEYPKIIGYPSVNQIIETSKQRFDFDELAKRYYGEIL